MENLIIRDQYLGFLHRHKDKPITKVVSGVRRSGKSTLFRLFQKDILDQGIEPSQIISINFEDLAYQSLLDYQSLYDYILLHRDPFKMTYIFLDEIQQVDQFERVINSLLLQDLVDIYITGSNAYFLSSELATLLTGRYVQLNILPLSFKEFVSWHTNNGVQESLENYYESYIQSSFPYTLGMKDSLERLEYLQGIYSTVVLNDIVKRNKIQDVWVLERLIETLYSSIGSLTTINKLRITLVSKGYNIAHQTISNYMTSIQESLILYEAKRYNIHGRNLLETQSKYYAVDVGLRQFVLRDHMEDYGYILENIIFLELKRRNYTVYVGKNHRLEVDFVAITPQQEVEYYQVALTTLDQNTLERELKSLQSINDNNPKYLLTLDRLNANANYDGILKINALEWLMGDD